VWISAELTEQSSMAKSDERNFLPEVCEFWQLNRIPRSPLAPGVNFLRWMLPDSEENYHRAGNKHFSVESVGYEFNSLGYRSSEFNRQPGERGILFLGDSHTLGVGMPWEGLWTFLVTRHLEERCRRPVRQFNLAWGATGTDHVAMMVHQCVDVLRPDAVFVLWSHVGRMTWFPDTRRRVSFFPGSQLKIKEYDAYLRLATDAHGFFNYVRNFHFVRDRLLRQNIPFYWGNLDRYSNEMLQWYLPLDRYVGLWERLDLARDGRHNGFQSHARFASLMIEAIERDKLPMRLA
jgi:hypothetical protein